MSNILTLASLAYEAAINAAWDNYLTATDGVVGQFFAEHPDTDELLLNQMFEDLDIPATAARNAAVLAAQNAYRAITRPGGPLGRDLI